MWAKNTFCSQWSSEAVQYVCVWVRKNTHVEHSQQESFHLWLSGWLEYADTFLYHFHEPPPRHPRVLSLFYISLTTNTPPTLLSETSTWTATDTQILPSGSCTYSPSERQSWSPPTQSWQKHCWYYHQLLWIQGICLCILIMCHSRECRGKMRICLRPCTHVCDVCLRACVIFLFSLEKYVNVFICLGLCVRVCLCLSPQMCQRFCSLVSFSEKCGGAPSILLQML